jgi:hypothetical protein
MSRRPPGTRCGDSPRPIHFEMQLADALATSGQWLGHSSGLIRGMNDGGAAFDLLKPYDAAIIIVG